MADSDTTARGLLMLRPIPTFFMEDLDMDTLDTPDPYYGYYGLGYGVHLGYAGLGYGLGYGGVVYGKLITSRSFSEQSAGFSTKMDCCQFEVSFT